MENDHAQADPLPPALHLPHLQVHASLGGGLRERPRIPSRHGRILVYPDLPEPRPRRQRSDLRRLLQQGAAVLSGVLDGSSRLTDDTEYGTILADARMSRTKYILLIPVRYNDGRRVPKKKLKAILRELLRMA